LSWQPPPLAEVWGTPKGCRASDGVNTRKFCACEQAAVRVAQASHNRGAHDDDKRALIGIAGVAATQCVTTFWTHGGGDDGVCSDYVVVARFCTGDREWLYLACARHQAVQVVHLDDCVRARPLFR